MTDTVGLERYKEAMLATARILYPPEPEPERKPPPRRLRKAIAYNAPRGYIFIGPYAVPAARSVAISEIQTEVSQHYCIPPIEMVSQRRGREVAWPRQVSMYLSKQLTPRSLPEIGARHGHRDHTTVIHAIRAVEQRRAMDPDLDRDIRTIRSRLRSGL